jgi:hypothetical protein
MIRAPRRPNRLSPLATVLALAGTLGLSGCWGGEAGDSRLTRLATLPLGAEVTGLYLTANGDLFLNAQHPSDSNAAPFNRATVGVVEGQDFRALPRDFPAVSVPASRADKQRLRTAVGRYRILGREGETFGGNVAHGLGAIVDDAASGERKVKQSNDPDFNGFVPLTADGDEGYLYTNWEDRPGGLSRLHIRRDGDGTWAVVDDTAEMLDFASVDGTWVNCFGTVTPWGNPLSSEELYFDETEQWNDREHEYLGGVQDLAAYLGYPTDGSGAWPNPYQYGYIVEITRADQADPGIAKRYALGRFSHENAVVMPDEQTVYLSDDGTGTVFFKFVADQAGDLSSGTLYAAQATQDRGVTDPADAGFDLRWLALGQASDAEIAEWIADYDAVTVDGDAEPDYITDQQINDWAEAKRGKDLDGSGRVAEAPFGDDRVAFLESRKAAAALGATAEFRKMEGVNINDAAAKDGSVPFMYMAMSNVNRTMADDRGDIQLAANECGVVYRMPLEEGYDVSRMEPAVAGGPYEASAAANPCAVTNIAEPDNLVVMADGRVIIGEDTDQHANNMLWVYAPGRE